MHLTSLETETGTGRETGSGGEAAAGATDAVVAGAEAGTGTGEIAAAVTMTRPQLAQVQQLAPPPRRLLPHLERRQ